MGKIALNIWTQDLLIEIAKDRVRGRKRFAILNGDKFSINF